MVHENANQVGITWEFMEMTFIKTWILDFNLRCDSIICNSLTVILFCVPFSKYYFVLFIFQFSSINYRNQPLPFLSFVLLVFILSNEKERVRPMLLFYITFHYMLGQANYSPSSTFVPSYNEKWTFVVCRRINKFLLLSHIMFCLYKIN